MTIDLITGALDERREQMYLDEEHQVFLLTGQPSNSVERPDGGRRAYVLIKPFHGLPQDVVAQFREVAKPMDAASRLSVTINSDKQFVSVYDGFTQTNSHFPLQILSQEIQDRHKKGPDAFERKFMPA